MHESGPRIPWRRQLYLVAVTGYDGPDARDKVMEAGFNLHLTKPVDGNEVTNLLSNSRRKRGAGSMNDSDVPTTFDAPAAKGGS